LLKKIPNRGKMIPLAIANIIPTPNIILLSIKQNSLR